MLLHALVFFLLCTFVFAAPAKITGPSTKLAKAAGGHPSNHQPPAEAEMPHAGLWYPIQALGNGAVSTVECRKFSAKFLTCVTATQISQYGHRDSP